MCSDVRIVLSNVPLVLIVKLRTLSFFRKSARQSGRGEYISQNMYLAAPFAINLTTIGIYIQLDLLSVP